MSMILLWAAASAASVCPAQGTMLDAMAAAVEARYASAQDAVSIAAQIRHWRSTGRYAAACADSHIFLERLNRDLDAYDGHFHVERVGAADGEDWLLAWRREAKSVNAGMREVAVLDGNVGYLRISSFYPWDVAREKYLAAWSLLADVEGLIIDLRQNGGGDSVTAGHVVQSALGGAVPAVQSIDRRGRAVAEELPRAGLPAIPATVSIIILVDRRSASASEFVAYSLQQERRAQIVGSRSAGAASMMGDPLPLEGGFQVIIPEARPLNRVSGRNWEGSGVVPDVPGGDDPVYVARNLLEKARGSR